MTQITICGHGRNKYSCQDCAKKDAAQQVSTTGRYSHLYSIGFDVHTDNPAELVTQAELFAAIRRRIWDLWSAAPQEMIEACGVPHETTDNQETDIERITRENIEAITELPTPEEDAADLAAQTKQEIAEAIRVFDQACASPSVAASHTAALQLRSLLASLIDAPPAVTETRHQAPAPPQRQAYCFERLDDAVRFAAESDWIIFADSIAFGRKMYFVNRDLTRFTGREYVIMQHPKMGL